MYTISHVVPNVPFTLILYYYYYYYYYYDYYYYYIKNKIQLFLKLPPIPVPVEKHCFELCFKYDMKWGAMFKHSWLCCAEVCFCVAGTVGGQPCLVWFCVSFFEFFLTFNNKSRGFQLCSL